MGINMKDTIFEITDEKQSEIEKQTCEQDFQKAKLQQLKQSVDQHDQCINLYKQKIEEYQQKIKEHNRSKYQQEYQIRELERDIVEKQKIIEKIENEIQQLQQNPKEVKIPQQEENSQIINIKDPSIFKDLEINNENYEQIRGDTTSINEISKKHNQYSKIQQKQFKQIY